MQRYLFTAVSAFLLLAGCNQAEQEAVSVVEQAAKLPSFYKTVPADTPYLYATLEPTPTDIIDHFIGKTQPMLNLAQAQLSSTLEQLRNNEGEKNKLGVAVLEEFDGKISREGLESLGLSLQPDFLAYGYGPFPVVRIGIGDAAAIKALIARVAEKTGLALPAQSLNGAEYWSINEDDVSAVVAVLDDHIVFSVMPQNLIEARLPEILNQQQPAATLDVVSSIGALNAENGYTPHGSGYLDFAKISTLLLDGTSPEALALKEMLHSGPGSLSEQCKVEFASIANQFERLETGYTQMSTESMGFGIALDLEESLAAQLAALTVAGIGFDKDPGGLASFAVGFDLMQLREWIMQLAASRNASPYQCEHLMDLNQQFRQAQDQVNQPIPPFVGNFMGFRGRLDSVDMSSGEPTNIQGVFALATSNPEMLLGMAQMFLPSMAELTVDKNAKPVPLPLAGLPVPEGIENPHIAMSDTGLGISIGPGTETGLSEFLTNNGSKTGTIFALGYDFGFYLDQIMANMGRGYDKPAGDLLEADEMQFYKNLVDRQYNEIRLTDQGIEASQVITFK